MYTFQGQLLMSETSGIAQARASNQWMVNGDFGFDLEAGGHWQLLEDTAYPNVLLTCINPLNSTMAQQFYSATDTVSDKAGDNSALEQEIGNYSDWIYEAERNDELIFAPHAIDSPFQVPLTYVTYGSV